MAPLPGGFSINTLFSCHFEAISISSKGGFGISSFVQLVIKKLNSRSK